MRKFSSCRALRALLRARASAYGAAPYGRWGGTIRGTVSRPVDKFCKPGRPRLLVPHNLSSPLRPLARLLWASTHPLGCLLYTSPSPRD